MQFINDGNESQKILKINDNIKLCNIPLEAHQYAVNGRTPLEWFIDRYRISQDKQTGIVNDPNEWFENPKDLIAAIRRIVYVSVESVRVINELPDPFESDDVQ